MKVELTQEWCMNMAKIEESADDAATMCVWCEQRVQGACKSHYDTLTCTHRVIVPTAEEWGSAVEARAAELHEGCRMPIEQARELAASEASPDWYARGQDWGLADALTNGQSGDWVLDDIARAFAAGAAAKMFTADRAGEVQADMNTLREYSKTQKQAPGCKTPAGCSENGCLGWCDDHRPEARAGVEDLQREVARLKVENARLAEETMRLQGLLNAAHQIVGELARPSGI